MSLRAVLCKLNQAVNKLEEVSEKRWLGMNQDHLDKQVTKDVDRSVVGKALRYNENMDRDKNISRMLCALMRWSLDRYGLQFRSDGFVSAFDVMGVINQILISTGKVEMRSPNEFQQIIGENNKRLQYQNNGNGDVEFVRCYQGHSEKFYSKNGRVSGLICIDDIFKNINSKVLGVKDLYFYHDTFWKFMDSIRTSGLKPGRRFLHLWQNGALKDEGRSNAELTLKINTRRAIQEFGVNFYEAGNGVVLVVDQTIDSSCFSIESTEAKQSGTKTGVDSGYVSFDGEADSKKLILKFAEDLRVGKMDSVLYVIYPCLKGDLELCDGFNELKQFYKTQIIAWEKTKSGKASQNKPGIKVNFRYNASNDMYIVMITGKNDSELMAIGRKYGFPRGCPVLWKIGSFIDFRGFYPKFNNDPISQQPFDGRVIENVVNLMFFKKWSGFLLHVIAWKGPDGVSRWTVCSKNSADPKSQFVQWGVQLITDLISKSPLFVDQLAANRLYLGGEAMITKDTHGYVALKDALVVTCMGQGTFANLNESESSGDSLVTTRSDKLMNYYTVWEVSDFCNQYSLLCDTAVRCEGEFEKIKTVVEAILCNRDMLKCSDVDQVITKLESDGLVVLKSGPAKHLDIAGEILEGFVFSLTRMDGSTDSIKVKLPHYTWKTMFFRELIVDLYKTSKSITERISSDSIDEADIASFAFDWNDIEHRIRKYVERWCCSDDGKVHFTSLLKGASVLLYRLSENSKSGAPLSRIPTGRVHIHIAAQVETFSADEIEQHCQTFDSFLYQKDVGSAGAPFSKQKLCICFCLGPFGSGKTTLMNIISEIITNHQKKCVCVDGDEIAINGLTECLGIDRNAATKSKIWIAFSRGQIPIVSQGGGCFTSRNDHDELRCTFRDDVRAKFKQECEILVVIPQRTRTASTQVKKISIEEIESTVNGIFPDKNDDLTFQEELNYVQDVLERRKWTGFSKEDGLSVSVKNLEHVLAICRDADTVMTVPYTVTESTTEELPSKGMLTHSRFSGVSNLSVVNELLNPFVGVTGSFQQIRAIMWPIAVKELSKVHHKHVTLGFGAFEIDKEKWDLLDGLIGNDYVGHRYSMKLQSVSKRLNEIKVDHIPEMDDVLFGERDDRYAHITIETGLLEPKQSLKVIQWFKTADDESKLPLTISTKNGKDTFIFSERIESTHTQMIGKNGLTVFQRDGSAKMTTIPGNYSEGTETIVYKCIAIAAGDHVEFNPKK